jgi:hypothetical protein
MSTFLRAAFVVVLSLSVLFADATFALAQRSGFNFGGNNSNNNQSGNQGGNRRNRNRDEDENNSNIQQFQELIQGQGGQSTQNNSGNPQQFRRNTQQGGQFQNSQQFQNSSQLQQFIGGNQGGQNFQRNNWQSQKFVRRNELNSWVIGFNGGPQPFSNAWYKNHPQAWHHHNDNDAWQIATTAAVFGWLGWQANRPYNNTTIIYEPVPVDTIVVAGEPNTVADAVPGEWMTLGVYSLMTAPGDTGTRMLQLSVDKRGHIRGSYYDMIANATYNVVGIIDKNTQQVRWTLDNNRQLTFVATLDQLTQSQGVVNVKLPGGQVQQWQLVRMENATASNY